MTLSTFFSDGTLGTPAAFLTAALVGLAFGASLERAGFGSSRRLAGVFYLRDMTVIQVMFTALATAAVGLALLERLGLVDRTTIYALETFLAPQAVGGLIFGVGFVVGGWCPGTALVGLASAKGDALVFLLGAMLGSLGYAAGWPALSGFAEAGACGVATLPQLLGLSTGVTTLLVVLMALAVFVVIDRLAARKASDAAEGAAS